MSGPGGYITPAIEGVPNASERWRKSEEAHKWVDWVHKPCRLGDPHCFKRGRKSELAHKWVDWLHNPSRLGGPQCFRVRDKIRKGPQGQIGYITLGDKIGSGPRVGGLAGWATMAK